MRPEPRVTPCRSLPAFCTRRDCRRDVFYLHRAAKSRHTAVVWNVQLFLTRVLVMPSSDTRGFAASQIWIVVLALACQACGWSPFASKEEYVRRGRQFAEQGRYPDAILQYRKALQKDASYGEAYLRYGQLLVRTKNPAEAFEALSREIGRASCRERV